MSRSRLQKGVKRKTEMIKNQTKQDEKSESKTLQKVIVFVFQQNYMFPRYDLTPALNSGPLAIFSAVCNTKFFIYK